jgi:hypothetical protein
MSSRDYYDDTKYKKEKETNNNGYEPLIDTTTLKIKIKATGDLETKDYDLIPFHPHMADLADLSNNTYILFPYYVKITMRDLQNAGVGQDYQKVFMDLDKFIKLIKYVTGPDRETDNTLIVNKKSSGIETNETTLATITKDEPPTAEEIITNNIGLIKNLFFAPKKRFYILGNEYIIGESNYLPPYTTEGESKSVANTSDADKIPLFYIVTFQLQLLDAANNPGVGDFSRLSCKAKKASIAKDTMDIFGTNFGYKEEPRIFVPSILNTSEATKNRKFGKIQREWEERNKYMKPPTTERERIERESKMTALQKKMAEVDKNQEEYKKIPPLWIKEREESTTKYANYTKAIVKLWQEYKDIQERNKNDIQQSFVKDMLDDVIDKMRDLTNTLLLHESEITEKYTNDINSFLQDIALNGKDAKNIETLINNNIYIKKNRDEEEAAINEKYVRPFIVGNVELDKDITAIEANETAIKEKLELLYKSPTTENIYSAQGLKEELQKVQAELVKKRTEKQKGKDAPTIIKGWQSALKKKEDAIKGIDVEKTKEEKKYKNEALNKELKRKMEEIQKAEKELLLAKYTEGDLDELTSDEKKQFERKSERSLESVSDIEPRLASLKDDYLLIADKLGIENKIQGEITLVNEDNKRIESLIRDLESKKRDLDRSHATAVRDIRDIEYSTRRRGDEKKTIKPIEEKRLSALTRDEETTQNKINTITETLDKLRNKNKKNKEYINDIKKIMNTPNGINKAVDFKERKKDNEEEKKNTGIRGGGRGNTRKKYKKRRHRKTNRPRKLNNRKTLRLQKRKKKHTRRRRG